jgi:hypothetical protein
VRSTSTASYPTSRSTTLAADGTVTEAFDDDGDGAADRFAIRRRVDGALHESLTSPGGTLLARQATWFDGDGAPVRLERDADGDGEIDVTKAWSRDDHAAVVEVVRMAAGGEDLYQVIRASRATSLGVETNAAETDTWPDGIPDVVWRADALWGLPIYNGYVTATTSASLGLEIDRECPAVDARITPPPFRAHCPPTSAYQACWIEARAAEPAIDTF